ncbi:MAG: DUF4013 domain-containing protein [Chloroflexi bacterium]|nr:MAG: DUF4013 domain-containing protein [Chloroflexota bacterium]
MDVARAFSFPFEDKRWLEKLAIGAGLSFFTFLLFPIPLLNGYMVKIARNVQGGVEGLPEWDDWGTLFRDGLMVLIAQFVYTLPFWLLACVAFIATIGFSGLSELSEDAAAAGIVATFGLIACLGVLAAIAWMFVSPALVVQYVRHGDLGACLRIGEVLGIVRDQFSDIVIAMLALLALIVGFLVVGTGLAIIPCLGGILAYVLSLALSPYTMMISGHLYGQIAARAGKGGLAADI